MTEDDLDTMLQKSAAPMTTPLAMPTSHISHISLPGESANSDTTPPLPHEDHGADLQSMAYGMTAFLDKVSSHTGVEFPW